MKRKIPLLALCVLFLGMAAYFGIQWYNAWQEYRDGEAAYAELTQYINNESPAPTPTEPTQAPTTAPTEPQKTTEPTQAPQPEEPPEPTQAPEETVWPEVDFAALRAINPDTVGWIQIEGTNINYPVVQGKDNSYYLYRLFDGGRNNAGSIFMDFRNDSGITDRNTVLYGHHMQNGTMFQQITKYKEQAFYDQHPVALLLTPGKNYRIEFIAGYVTDMNADAWQLEFASDEEFRLWLDNAVSRSTFTSTAAADGAQQAVTFSTCTYEYNDARYVLVGDRKSVV